MGDLRFGVWGFPLALNPLPKQDGGLILGNSEEYKFFKQLVSGLCESA